MSAALVRELLDYDAATGRFTWKVRTAQLVHIGDVAGSVLPAGYIGIGIRGRLYLAHRLAWLHVTGSWPSGEVDHLNGDKADNRFANLRDVAPSVNRQNIRRAQRRSATGIQGVIRATSGRYWAVIRSEGRQLYLGMFDSADEASKAYVAAKRRLHAGCTI